MPMRPLVAATMLLAAVGLTTAAGCARNKEQPPQRPFEGLAVRTLVLDSPAMQEFVRLHAPDWQLQTGAKVELISDPDTSADVFIAPLARLGELAARFLLAELPIEVYEPDPTARRDWPEPVRDHLWYWGPTRCVVPLSVRTFVLVWIPERLPESMRSRVEGLKTWQDLDSLLQTIPGTGPQLVVPDVTTAVLLRAATYARTPESFAFLFEPWRGTVLVDSPAFVRAVDEWRRVRDRVAEGNAREFVQSTAALAILPTDAMWPLLGEEASDLMVRFNHLPGTNQYYDAAEQDWASVEEGAEPHRVSYLDAVVAVVPDGAEHQDAAVSLVSFLVSPDTSLAGVVDPEIGAGPFRLSHFRRTGQWGSAGWDVSRLGDYFAATRAMLANRVAVEALQVRNQATLMEQLRAALSELWAGDTPSVERLTRLREAWEQAMERDGKDRIIEDYRRSVGLLGIERN